MDEVPISEGIVKGLRFKLLPGMKEIHWPWKRSVACFIKLVIYYSERCKSICEKAPMDEKKVESRSKQAIKDSWLEETWLNKNWDDIFVVGISLVNICNTKVKE